MARIVLVADDSPTIQKRAVGILKGEGFEVETVSNGVAAVKRLASLRPVVILADVTMPGRDGYEVCEYVKKSPDLAHVPVLLIASDMEPYNELRGARVRADGRVIKPFDAYELISIVHRFAAQCEASAPPEMVVTEVLEAPTAAPPAEFFLSDQAEVAPTVVHQNTPDFSAASEGIAFSAPGTETEAASNYLTEPSLMVPEVPAGGPPFEKEIAPARESTREFPSPIFESETAAPPVREELMVPEDPVAPPAVDGSIVFEELIAPMASVAPAAESPMALDEAQVPAPEVGTDPEPVFIEDQAEPVGHSHPHEGSETHEGREPVIFNTPVQLADPVWRDETLAAPAPAEPAEALALPPELEPRVEAEPSAPELTEGAEPEPAVSLMSATSLDSFSLDDASNGQVHFASRDAETLIAQASAGQGATEAPPVREASTVAPAESAEEPAADVTAVETPVEAPAEAFAEVAHEAPAGISPEALAEVPLEASSGVPPEAFAEIPLESPLEPLPEAAEVSSEAPAEAPPELPAPLLQLDWSMISEIVRRVVVRMSPPLLPKEAAEEMARKLAEEIATELGQQPLPHQ